MTAHSSAAAKGAVLVTGGSGNVGREVVSALAKRGWPCRAPTRPEFDFHETSTWAAALDGCDRLFLLRPPAIAKVETSLHPFVDMARARGVEHIVFLSVAGAGDNRFIPHHAVEQHLMAGPRDWTLLRPGFFAQNLQDAYLRDIVEDDRLYVPAGDARVAFVDLRDVAEVAAAAFAAPEHHVGEAHHLTGGEAVSFDDAARWLTEALGRPVRYTPAPVLGYLRHLLGRRHLSWPHSIVQTVLHVLLRRGDAEAVEPTLERLLQRPPHTLRDYIEDHAATWAKPAPPAR